MRKSFVFKQKSGDEKQKTEALKKEVKEYQTSIKVYQDKNNIITNDLHLLRKLDKEGKKELEDITAQNKMQQNYRYLIAVIINSFKKKKRGLKWFKTSLVENEV